jgi:hypothetical protein
VTTNPHRPNYFKPDFFNGIGASSASLRALQERSPDRTDSRRSALAAGGGNGVFMPPLQTVKLEAGVQEIKKHVRTKQAASVCGKRKLQRLRMAWAERVR